MPGHRNRTPGDGRYPWCDRTKFGTARALGGLTGSQLNPAPYAFATSKMPDQRVAVGYAVLFPVSMIAKVFLAQLMVVFF